MDEFYIRADGVIVLVIRHNGSTFDYINGYKNNNYFAKWADITPLMKPGHFYGIACKVKDHNGKASFTPFGISTEFANEQAAKEFSFELKQIIEKDNWNGELAFEYLKEQCMNYLLEWTGKKIIALEKLVK